MAYELGECRRCKRELTLYSRQLCKSCYQYIRIAVKTGKTSWAEMMDKGFGGNRAQQGRPPTLPTLEAMVKATGTQDALKIMQDLLREPPTDEERERANEEV